MPTLVIEHLKAGELPRKWAQQLTAKPEQTVTVRIETEFDETVTEATETFVTDDPAFGIWRDREEMADVEAYINTLRAARYGRDGSRKEG